MIASTEGGGIGVFIVADPVSRRATPNV